jgi:hypothetical protein
MRFTIIRFQTNGLLSRKGLQFPYGRPQAQTRLQFLPGLIGCQRQIRIESKTAFEVAQAHVYPPSDVVIPLANENTLGRRLVQLCQFFANACLPMAKTDLLSVIKNVERGRVRGAVRIFRQTAANRNGTVGHVTISVFGAPQQENHGPPRTRR